jgi:hypothetical protein
LPWQTYHFRVWVPFRTNLIMARDSSLSFK